MSTCPAEALAEALIEWYATGQKDHALSEARKFDETELLTVMCYLWNKPISQDARDEVLRYTQFVIVLVSPKCNSHI